jgi:2-(1,2-epoxy-1,2-dihydrophenyl)acetyl-CoA isomerase
LKKVTDMPSVLFEIKENIARITLNRPEKYNSFNREMALLLQDHLDTCQSDPDIRAIYLTGAGKAFCAGQDLGEVTGDNPVSFQLILSEHYNPIIRKIRELKKPVLCAVNGVAAGAGANIALCCDVVVASNSASFLQAFSKIGLIPDSSGTYFLPRLIGFQKASALMMLGDKVPAREAESMGMIYKCIDDDTFEQESLRIASTLASMPTRGLALTKQALNSSMQNNLSEQLQVEDILQNEAAHTSDYSEGVASFIEKRKPVFKGA